MMAQTTETPTVAEDEASEPGQDLSWRVHLARRSPRRLPVVALVVLIGAGCIWMMFHQTLPVVAAVLLLLGACSDFLLPLHYRITDEGVHASGVASRLNLPWKDARRCLLERNALTLTPLPVASRLDAFRGVTLRFARRGEPGDRASVLEAVRRYAPGLLPTAELPVPAETVAECTAPGAKH